MLSIGAMSSGQGSYYLELAREDYYLSGGEPPGKWHGEGVEHLGLTDKVVDSQLRHLLSGNHPISGRPLIQNSGAKDHQPGWDLTFSAPKSVSVLWALSDPETRMKIQDAHFAAIKDALDYLQDTAAFTRRGKGGHIRQRGKLIAAVFEHGTSRAQDPNLHSHALIANVCVRDDGTTGTIQSKPYYQAKMVAGALYRASLAAYIERSLHVEIKRVNRWFEIAGVPEALIRMFSKRREQVLAEMSARGWTGASAAAMVTLATREVKGHVARDTLLKDWRIAAEVRGWGVKQAEALLSRTQGLAKLLDAHSSQQFLKKQQDA